MNIKEMQKSADYDAIIIFRNNHFLGQDIKDSENEIRRLTGFDGSAGTLIITKDQAFLFVDGRYDIQARHQTSPDEIQVIVISDRQDMLLWLKKNLATARIAYNPWQISGDDFQELSQTLPKAEWIKKPCLISTPPATVFAHRLEYCGVGAEQKITDVTTKFKQRGDTIWFTGSADNVSWLTNLRSDSLPETPIIRAMALIDKNAELTLFADNLQFSDPIGFKTLPISEIENILGRFSGEKIALNCSNTPQSIIELCQKYNIIIDNVPDFCAIAKAKKNATELQGIINAHLRDGVALCKFLYWFDNHGINLSENDIVQKLHQFRHRQSLFYADSFATIAGFGSNSAIVHYQPKADNCAIIQGDSVLLLDSGGQYFDGTTDVTRTIAVGSPRAEIIQKFTLVLKAHIALSSQIFPRLTSGTELDAICRSVLWNKGLNYNHGTGHGVGHFSNVHEGPQRISPHGGAFPFDRNVVVSVEPGVYLENDFGIRIENLVYTQDCADYNNYLQFIPLTLVPIDFRLIDKYLLSNGEKQWLNRYHQKVFEAIAPHLNGDEAQWLKKACSQL